METQGITMAVKRKRRQRQPSETLGVAFVGDASTGQQAIWQEDGIVSNAKLIEKYCSFRVGDVVIGVSGEIDKELSNIAPSEAMLIMHDGMTITSITPVPIDDVPGGHLFSLWFAEVPYALTNQAVRLKSELQAALDACVLK